MGYSESFRDVSVGPGPALSQLDTAPNSTDLGASSLGSWADQNCSQLGPATSQGRPLVGLRVHHDVRQAERVNTINGSLVENIAIFVQTINNICILC